MGCAQSRENDIACPLRDQDRLHPVRQLKGDTCNLSGNPMNDYRIRYGSCKERKLLAYFRMLHYFIDRTEVTSKESNSIKNLRMLHKVVISKAPNLEYGIKNLSRVLKSLDQVNHIKDALMKNFFFSSLSCDELDQIISFMSLQNIDAGKFVIKQGEPGDYFYVVEAGTFSYSVSGVTVGTGIRGSSFGELALMYDALRAASVQANTDAQLWALDQVTFKTILAHSAKVHAGLALKSLENVKVLKDLHQDDIKKLINVVSIVKYKAGETVIRKGDLVRFL